MAWPISKTTKHTCGGPVFGRKAPAGECQRCDELSAGKPAVEWSGARKARLQCAAIAAIRAHDCAASGCMSICTFGEW